LIAGCLTLSAQNDAQYTLFPWAKLYYNPGTTGEQTNSLCFTGIFLNRNTAMKENQWLASQTTATSNKPNGSNNDKGGSDWNENIGSRDFMFNVEYYSRKIRGAFGLSFVSDHIAIWNNVTIRLGYAYKMKIARGSLGIGLQAGLLNQSLNKAALRPLEDDDPLLVFSEDPTELNFDFNFGLYYKTDTWDVGISGVNLLGKQAKQTLSGEGLLNPSRQLYIHGGYNWILPSYPDWAIEPKALIKTDFASFQTDIAVLTRYKGVVWGGLSYRIQDAASILFGARPFYNSSNNYLKGLDVGFAYSFTTTKYGYTKRGSMGDIEVMVRYCFDFYKSEIFSGYGNSRAIYRNEY
jgi:type IX secretion system PorP/SprF family membrane protein